MKFGLLYSLRNPKRWYKPFPELYAEALDHIQTIESLGFDMAWLTEHHFIEDGYLPSVLPMAAAVATRTSTIGIGTFVLLLPLHHPVRVAEDAATVDIVSNGRFHLGVGLGYRIEEFAGYGVRRQDRPGRMEEGLEIIRRCWTEDRFSFEGKHFQLKDVSMTPKPVQTPHPPLWVGARGGRAIQRAARFGAPLLLVGGQPEYAAYVQGLQEHGREPKDYPVGYYQSFIVSTDPERTWHRIKEHVYYNATTYGDWYAKAADLPKDVRPVAGNVEETRRTVAILTSEDAVKQIQQWHQEVPFDHLLTFATWPGYSLNDTLSYLEVMAKKVIPHFRGKA